MEVGMWERQLVPLYEHIHGMTGIRPSSALRGGHQMNIKEESSWSSPAMKMPSAPPPGKAGDARLGQTQFRCPGMPLGGGGSWLSEIARCCDSPEAIACMVRVTMASPDGERSPLT